MECLSYCIANSIDLTRLDNHYKTMRDNYIAVKFRDVLRLKPCHAKQTLLFIFKNGTVVTWGVKRHHMDTYLDVIRLFADKIIPFKVHDDFSYRYGDRVAIEAHDFFDVDCMTIEKGNDEVQLSLSYGFSQSVKLQYFETILESLVEKYTPLIHSLSTSGEKPITRNQMRYVIGEILIAKSEMNLISNFLYHPKYFWQHPTLEEHYIMLERYLHLQRRVNTINHRLDTLNEIFEMFNDYLESRHTHRLEIMVIVLIALEIIFSIFNFHF